MASFGREAEAIFNTPCTGFNYDDLITIPSRPICPSGEVSLKTRFSRNLDLMAPLVASPMDSVCEGRMAISLALMGGIGIIHNHCTAKEQAEQVMMVKNYVNGFILDPCMLRPDHKVEDIDRIKAEKDVSTVLICENAKMGSKILGIVTSRDIDLVEDRKTPISQVMTPKSKLIVGSEPISLSQAHQKLRESKKGKLPIVNDTGELVAMVSRRDLKQQLEYPLASRDPNMQLLVGAAVSPRPSDYSRVGQLVEAGVDVLVIDASQSDTMQQLEFLKRVKNEFPSLDVVCGNIWTPKQAKAFLEAGADGLRVGRGCAALCSAGQEVSPIGRPQGSAVYHVARLAKQFEVPVIADGGVETASHLTMALSLGAESVMCGTLLAGTTESPGEIFYSNGRRLKTYTPTALPEPPPKSKKEKEEAVEQKWLPSSVSIGIVERGSARSLVSSLIDSIKHDMRRLGVASIQQLHADLASGELRFHVNTGGGQRVPSLAA
eukprot:gnl/TRDRNA2_/TRDRNA2_181383_c0_seq1.p1 gnl/TRDRNA2_/TRDRNA2_181383_c0~~gnl/TRDRNA2_/TRDRNA2_181383_c0_seq1.p1  ORF type:complete len:491 (+),score=113.94 gnl/TRDRNA2_/TRDRNA2_181383_c0_seq1:132-1604(+)